MSRPTPTSHEESSEESTEASEEVDERALTEPITNIERRFYVHKLIPSDVEKHIKPLKELNCELQKIQDEYARELYELERRYHEDAEEFYETREKIINGTYEPTSSVEQFWKRRSSEVDLRSFAEFYDKSRKLQKDFMGVPNFWLHIFTTADTISQIIHASDIEALRFLTNVTIDYDMRSFTIEFHFRENPFFENNLLVKHHFLENKLDEDNDPFGFEGFRICKCVGCNIHWKPGKNLTVKLSTKPNDRQKYVRAHSFFNFFNPPLVTADEQNNVDEEICNILNLHFKIGNFFREEIIPKALLYFTGDIVDNIDDEDDLVNSDEESSEFLVRDDDQHIAHVARVLHKIHWN